MQSVAADVRFPAKDDVLYAIALGWPADQTFGIKSLRNGNPYESRAIASVDFVSGSNRIQWCKPTKG